MPGKQPGRWASREELSWGSPGALGTLFPITPAPLKLTLFFLFFFYPVWSLRLAAVAARYLVELVALAYNSLAMRANPL